jgi:hypothetical protein
MHFLLMILRLMLERLFSLGGDNVKLAARADGRIEHVPSRRGPWDRLLQFVGDLWCQAARGALEVRAGDAEPPIRPRTSPRWTEPQP